MFTSPCLLRLYVALIIISIHSVNGLLLRHNLTCFCNNKNHNGHQQRKCINNQCTSKSILSHCYVSIINGDGEVEYGCTFGTSCNLYEGGVIKGNMCNMNCCRTSMCNKEMNITGLRYPCKEKKKETSISRELVIVLVAIPLSLIIIIMIVVMWKHFKKPSFYHSSLLSTTASNNSSNFIPQVATNFSSAGSGMGVPLLAEQTIAFQIVLNECVSKGKFGIVYRGTWQHEDVAVKIFSTGEETSWYCEREIYQTTMLRHENILGFIAADSKDTGTCTEYWLIMEYHSHGSLFNYLQTQIVDVSTMLKMASSIACGINHLHMQIVGNQAKPPIAHRDMKTKNILVKSDNSCCIGDLGLAITKTSVMTGTVNSSRTGTRRYHSPELLNDTMDTSYFEAYLKADIYALGLCIWEVCWRTKVKGETNDYHLPYFDHVPVNPSEEDMLQAVCVEQRRPTYPEYWEDCVEMKAMMRLMDECWCPEASARLPTLRIKKNMLLLCQKNKLVV